MKEPRALAGSGRQCTIKPAWEARGYGAPSRTGPADVGIMTVEDVTNLSSRPQDGVPSQHIAHNAYIDKDLASLRGVSASERTLEFAGSAPQAS